MKNSTTTTALGLLLIIPSAALATPIAGSMSFGVSVTANGDPTVSAYSSDSWTGTPAPLSVNALATTPNGSTAFGSGTSSWAPDGNSGSLGMQFGWATITASGVLTDLSLPNWSYTFTADATGNFVMDYAVVGSGFQFGLWGFNLSHNFASGSGAPLTSPFSASSSGQFVGAVVAGQTYTASLSNNGNVSGGPFSYSGSAVGDFQWRVTNLPDSGSTLALLGLALGGFALRRNR